jgi:signal transduction histidine kinase/CheY-like chemotaxis protein
MNPVSDAGTGARMGWLVVRTDGVVLAADEGACAIVGAPDTAALVGRTWASLVARGDASTVAEALALAAAGHHWRGRVRFLFRSDPVLVEGDLAPADPSAAVAVLHFRLPAAPPRPARGPLPASSRTLAARLAVEDALREIADPEAAARAALQAAGGAVRFDWALVLRFVPRGTDPAAHVVAVYPGPLAGVTAGATWMPLGPAEMRVWRSGEPALESDAARDPGDRSPLARLTAFGLRARVHVPLYAGAHLAGAAVLYRRAAGFTPEEGALAEEALRSLGLRVSGGGPRDARTAQRPPGEATPPVLPRARLSGSPPDEAAPPPSPPPAAHIDRASERLGALGELISGVAHELNNPLTAILGYAQILSSLQGEEHERAIRTIEEEAERAARIVRNLLAFARQQPGRRGPVDLEEVVERVVALRRYALEIDGVTVETRFGRVPEVVGDAAHLEEVALNLLNNAHQALRGRGGRVVIATERAATGVRLIVEDDGPGIPDELRPRVFEPFFTTRADGESAGMGLATVYGIVTEHGGRVWTEQGESGGARFVVELPGAALGGRAPDVTPVAPPGQTRILVVDDEEPIRALTAELLTTFGYQARTAAGGAEALDLLEREPFDLLVVDVRMPGMDGAALHDQIVERWPRLARRVVFVTGDPEAERSGRFRDRQGVRFLEKPFHTRELVRTIREILTEVPPAR